MCWIVRLVAFLCIFYYPKRITFLDTRIAKTYRIYFRQHCVQCANLVGSAAREA